MTITQTLYKHTTQPNGKTFWRLVVKVCNDTDHEVTGAVTSNPWPTGDRSDKILLKKNDKQEPIKGSDTDAAKAGAKKVTLAPKGQKGECVEVEFSYDVEPATSYTDFYRFTADGKTLEKEPVS